MKAKRYFFSLLLCILPILIASYSLSFVDNLRTIAISKIRPFLIAADFLSRNLSSSLTQANHFIRTYRENKDLKMEVSSLKQKIIELEELKKENERLKNLLGFKEAVRLKAITAQVIARDISHWSKWIVINKGTNQGIKKNMVLVNEKGLIGRVMSVDKNTARAILLTDPESRVSGILQASRDTGMVEGEGGKFLKMCFLDLDSQIKIGEVVISSGLGGIYPKGLPLGVVEAIATGRDKLTLYALVRPFVDFSKLEEVLCLEYIPPV